MATPALELDHVSKSYPLRDGTVRAVYDVSFSVMPGTVFGFLGPNGAGKTTTMKMIVGLAKPTAGSIAIFGHEAGSLEAAAKIGYLPESPTFYRYLSGLEFMLMHGQLAGLNKQEAETSAAWLLDSVGLKEAGQQRIGQYSKGMVQRLGLANALIGNPQIIFLDEPFDGLDVLGRFEMKQLILKLKRDQRTIFFNSHILSDVAEICDLVGIIDRGRLLEFNAVTRLVKKGQTLEQYFVARVKKGRQ